MLAPDERADQQTTATKALAAPSSDVFHIVVVGAGLAGCLCALLLSRMTLKVPIKITVLESRPDPRSVPASAARGRSINLALSVRGLTALAVAGLDQSVRNIGVPMHGRCVHGSNGRLSKQPYGKKGEFLLSVSRTELNKLLIEACTSQPNIQLHFEAKCTAVDLDVPEVLYNVGQAEQRMACTLVVGADGVYSRVRSAMERQTPRFDTSREHISAEYKELIISWRSVKKAGEDLRRANPKKKLSPRPEETVMPREYLHVWPRRQHMLIALPNQEGSFTATLFMNAKCLNDLSSAGKAEVTNFFATQFPDAIPLLPDLNDQFFNAPSSPLMTVRCYPYHHENRAVVIGDAAHAVVPFYGQGCNAAFEDCILLVGALENHGRDGVHDALHQFSANRKADANAIADLAIEHYHDMASNSASISFAIFRRLGIMLHTIMPNMFMPLYSMITFSTIPYATAIDRKRKQDRIISCGLGLVAVLTVGTGLLRPMITARWMKLKPPK